MRDLKSFIRSFLRKPTTGLINIIGLSSSLTLVILLSAYCYNELTTDKHHEKKESIYLFAINSKHDNSVGTPWEFKNKIDESLPKIVNTVRIGCPDYSPILYIGEEVIKPNLIFADKEFFDIFTYKKVEGDLVTALNDPLSIVLTKSFAKKIFGNEPAIGKTFKAENNQLLTVKAVIEEPHNNSFLSFNALASHEAHKIIDPYRQFNGWDESSFLTFIELSEKVSPQGVALSIWSLYPEDRLKVIKEMGIKVSGQITSIDDIYFSDLAFYQPNINKGNKRKTLILLMVAGLVLSIAIFNFISISTFQWYDKLRQIGTMKVFGASKIGIVKRLLYESLLVFGISYMLALYTVQLIAPIIQELTGMHFRLEIIYSYQFLSLSIVSTIILCILVSIVPILKIASSKTISNLQKKLISHKQRISTRLIIVKVQFTIAIVLIIFTLLVQKQINFGSTNLGFKEEMNLAIPFNRQMWGKNEVFKDFLEKIPAINYSFTQFYPGKEFSKQSIVKITEGEEKKLDFYRFCADEAFFQIMDLKFVKGKSFSNNSPMDKFKVIVNETFVHKYNIDKPMGLELMINEDTFNVVGVVKDFHYQPVNKEIAPLVIRNLGYTSVCLINIASKDFKVVHSTIKKLKEFTATLSPDFPVEIKFLDQALEDMYRSEIRFRRTFSLFAIAAIIICCMGVFALSLFACQKRMIEIGVRKVNGATVWEIIKLLNYKFTNHIIVAFFIASPVAYYASRKWLESYVYKTQISWWLFLIAGLSVLFISLVTVTLQSLNSAKKNPVCILRDE